MLYIFGIFFTLISISLSQSQCSFHSNAHWYDLTPLKHAEGQDDYYIQVPLLEVNWYLNICANTELDCLGDTGTAVTIDPFDESECIVVSVPTESPTWELLNNDLPDSGVKVTYQNGQTSACKNLGGTPLMTFQFECDQNEETATLYDLTEEPENSCHYYAKFKSKYGCGVKKNFPAGGSVDDGEGLSSGWGFIITLCVFSTVYLAGGFLYNKNRGSDEMLIHSSFWRNIPGLVKDGCVFVFTRGKGSTGGYHDIDNNNQRSTFSDSSIPSPYQSSGGTF